MSHRSFGDRLRSARHREGMTQAEVADRIGTSSTLVCKWETGVHVPYRRYAHAIRRTLGVDLPPTHDRANEVDPRGFGKLLRQTRKGSGLSQYDLADRVGVTQSTISHWELGYSKPDHAMIVVLAVEVGDPLGLSRSEILEAAVEAIRRAEQGTLDMEGPTADEIISAYTGDDLQRWYELSREALARAGATRERCRR